MPTPDATQELAELPFLTLAVALASDTNLSDEEIAAAQRGLNGLDLDELMVAVRDADHSPTELFEFAWLEDNPADRARAQVKLLASCFGEERADALVEELGVLVRLVSAASDRPLRGQSREVFARRAERALGL
ncbi:MAG: hypothetical protein AAGF12_43620, partial [Myxococcota bacterium]